MVVVQASNINAMAHVRTLLSKGLALVPLKVMGKAPILRGWTERPITSLQEAMKYWGRRPNLNVGVVCGSKSGNLVVIDVDDADEERVEWILTWAKILFGDGFWAVRTARGLHIYVRSEEPMRTQSWTKVDLKGEGGQVVAPPSIHPSGVRYSWIIGPEDAELGTFNPSRILSFIERILPAEAKPKEPEKRIERPINPEELPEVEDDEIAEILPPCLRAHFLNGVEEGQRNEVAYLISKYLLSAGIEPEKVTSALLRFNERCKPPMPKEDVGDHLLGVVNRFLEEREGKPKAYQFSCVEVKASGLTTRELCEACPLRALEEAKPDRGTGTPDRSSKGWLRYWTEVANEAWKLATEMVAHANWNDPGVRKRFEALLRAKGFFENVKKPFIFAKYDPTAPRGSEIELLAIGGNRFSEYRQKRIKTKVEAAYSILWDFILDIQLRDQGENPWEEIRRLNEAWTKIYDSVRHHSRLKYFAIFYLANLKPVLRVLVRVEGSWEDVLKRILGRADSIGLKVDFRPYEQIAIDNPLEDKLLLAMLYFARVRTVRTNVNLEDPNEIRKKLKDIQQELLLIPPHIASKLRIRFENGSRRVSLFFLITIYKLHGTEKDWEALMDWIERIRRRLFEDGVPPPA